MARAVIVIGGFAWAVVAAACLLVAGGGGDTVVELLPGLALDGAGVERTAAALGIGCLVVAGVHLVVAVGLRHARRRTWSAAILLAGVMTAVFVALTAAALTSMAAGTIGDRAGLGGAAGAAAVASAYGLVAVRLVGRLRRAGRAG